MKDINNSLLGLIMTAAIVCLAVRQYKIERRLDAHKEYILLLKRYVELSDSVMIDRVEQQKAFLDIHLKHTAQ